MKLTVTVSPVFQELAVFARLIELTVAAAFVAAFAGTAENPAIANADAATSAMRLKLVFVDIIFLSRKVAIKNFFTAAWSEIAFS
jgi:hypothetical protein